VKCFLNQHIARLPTVTTKAAVAKMMFVLASTTNKKEIEKLLMSDLSGEITV
jgi:hypothetical protein